MLMYGVDDIRLFYENDLRFLEQFSAVKILVSWLRELVDVPVAPAKLASRPPHGGLRGRLGRAAARRRRTPTTTPSSTSRSRRTVPTA